MPIALYALGALVRVSVTFTNLAGAPADPTEVTAKIKKPDGTVTALVYGTHAALVKDDTGDYHVDIDASMEGQWFYRFEGTDAVQAVVEGEFVVGDSQFG